MQLQNARALNITSSVSMELSYAPLFEEFEGILGKPYHSNAPLALPSAYNQTPELLTGFFGVTLGQILPCMEGQFLLTLPLLEF